MQPERFKAFWRTLRQELHVLSWARKVRPGEIIILTIKPDATGGCIRVLQEAPSGISKDRPWSFFQLDITAEKLSDFEVDILDYNDVKDFAQDFAAALQDRHGRGTVKVVEQGGKSVGLELSFTEKDGGGGGGGGGGGKPFGTGVMELELVQGGVCAELVHAMEPFFNFNSRGVASAAAEAGQGTPLKVKEEAGHEGGGDAGVKGEEEEGSEGEATGAAAAVTGPVYKPHKKRRVMGRNITFTQE